MQGGGGCLSAFRALRALIEARTRKACGGDLLASSNAAVVHLPCPHGMSGQEGSALFDASVSAGEVWGRGMHVAPGTASGRAASAIIG